MADRVEKQSKPAHDPAFIGCVNRMIPNLIRNSDAKAPLSIQLIDSSDVNAFALPGGSVS